MEEIPSDHYVFDDEKHRAMHQGLNGETNGIFSSESEIYHENNRHLSSSSSFKNEGKSHGREKARLISSI